MKTMKKLQVAAAAASLFALAGVATAAQLNSSGAIIAAETIFPSGTLGNNTKIKAPTYTYSYEGGVNANASSRQKFKVAVNLVGGAQWARDKTRVGDDLLTFFESDGRQAATIAAEATVGGVRGIIPVLNNSDPALTKFAIRLYSIEAGDTIIGTPLQGSALTAVTYVFEVVNNTTGPLNLDKLSLSFSSFKSVAASVIPNADTDTLTTALDQFPTIYNLAALSVNTADGLCAVPNGAIILQAVSGNNDPAVLSQEDTVGNNQQLRQVGNYILIKRATDVTLVKSGDRLVQTTNSFQTNQGSTPVNGIGGTGGGRTTFKPATTAVANVYGGANGTGLFTVDNTVNAFPNATANTKGTFAERRTSGDERAAKLGTMTFANTNNPLDRLLDIDFYGFKGALTQLPNNATGITPSLGNQVGDFTNPVNPNLNNNGNVYGGVDLNPALPSTTPMSGAVVISFKSKASFTGFAAPAVGGTSSGLTLVRGNAVCTDTPAAGSVAGSLIESPVGSGQYYWRFSAAALAAAAGATPNDTVLGAWTVCYNVSGEANIPAATFTDVKVTVLKDDTTEQALQSCAANLASIYGGVKIDVRNFNIHRALPGANADQKNWFGVLRLINNSESDTATVEGQWIHNSGKYGPWGTLATLAPREAKYVFASTEGGVPGVYDLLATPVTNPTSEVLNSKPTTETTRVRISADVSTLRVQNYVFNGVTQALTEVSSAQGADFVNVDSSNRDHIDQDAQFDIVKDGGTLAQRPSTVDKNSVAPLNMNANP